MIPHIPNLLPRLRSGRICVHKTRKARLRVQPLRRSRSAELSCYESADGSTEFGSFLRVFCLREHPHDGLGARGTHEDPPGTVEMGVERLDLRAQAVAERLR